MRHLAGILESAIGQRESLPQLRILADIGYGARVQHHAGDTLFGEHLRRHSAGMARANNQYIYFVQHPR